MTEELTDESLHPGPYYLTVKQARFLRRMARYHAGQARLCRKYAEQAEIESVKSDYAVQTVFHKKCVEMICRILCERRLERELLRGH